MAVELIVDSMGPQYEDYFTPGDTSEEPPSL